MQAQECLHEEALRLLPSTADSLTPDSVKQMSYVKDVVKETLRLRPVIPQNVRFITEDVILEVGIVGLRLSALFNFVAKSFMWTLMLRDGFNFGKKKLRYLSSKLMANENQ